MTDQSNVSVRSEVMSGAFEKWHIDGLPAAAVLHHFSDVDRGDCHDHPFPFQSIVLTGGYVERVFRLDGTSELVRRDPGDSFRIEATHIHRIEELPIGDCWTLMLPGPHERTSGFWQFREDGAYHRLWHDPEWTKVEAPAAAPTPSPQTSSGGNLTRAADAYVFEKGIEHSGGIVEAAFEAGARWAGHFSTKPTTVCPDCGRQKAQNADDAAAGMCPKWWAIRDADAERDCERAKP